MRIAQIEEDSFKGEGGVQRGGRMEPSRVGALLGTSRELTAQVPAPGPGRSWPPDSRLQTLTLSSLHSRISVGSQTLSPADARDFP